MVSMGNPKAQSEYLVGIPALGDELLRQLNRRGGPSPAAVREAERVVARLRQLIRQARERHERQTGTQIIPERPLVEWCE